MLSFNNVIDKSGTLVPVAKNSKYILGDKLSYTTSTVITKKELLDVADNIYHDKDGNTVIEMISPFKRESFATLYYFNYEKGNIRGDIENNLIAFHKGNVEIIADLDIPKNGTIRVTSNESEYKIFYKDSAGVESLKYELANTRSPYMPNSFGFFSDHYDHGCIRIGRFDLTNLSIKVRLLQNTRRISILGKLFGDTFQKSS